MVRVTYCITSMASAHHNNRKIIKCVSILPVMWVEIHVSVAITGSAMSVVYTTDMKYVLLDGSMSSPCHPHGAQSIIYFNML